MHKMKLGGLDSSRVITRTHLRPGRCSLSSSSAGRPSKVSPVRACPLGQAFVGAVATEAPPAAALGSIELSGLDTRPITLQEHKALGPNDNRNSYPRPYVMPPLSNKPFASNGLDPIKGLSYGFMELSRKYGGRELMVHDGFKIIDFYMLSNPKDFTFILKNNELFVKPDLSRTSRFFGNGLVVAKDEALHKRQRELLNPGFRSEYIRSLVPLFATKSHETVETLLACNGARFDFEDVTRRLTLDIIGSAGFGADLGAVKAFGKGLPRTEDAVKIWEDIALGFQKVVFPSLLPPHMLPGWKMFDEGVSRIEKLLERIRLDRELKGIDPKDKDILAFMMREKKRQDEEEAKGGPKAWLTSTQMRDEVFTLMFAGSDTTSNTLTWAVYLASKHPEWAERVRAEVDAALGPWGAGTSRDYSKLSIEALAKMPSLMAIINETLRLMPSATEVTRLSTADTVIGGYFVPKNTVLFMSIFAMHRNPRVWPRPDEWLPERWLPEHSAELGPRMDDAFLPFSTGSRSCIGRYFAILEMQVVLSVLLCELDFESAMESEPVAGQAITMKVNGGMWLKTKPAA